MNSLRPPIAVGDRVQMRKPHPCGSDQWEVWRVGVDVGLRCLGCDRRVLLERPVFYKRLKRIVSSGQGKREEESNR